MNKSRKFNYIPTLSSYIFIIIPFVIMAIVKWSQGGIDGLFMMPDWSLVSSIVFGQVIVGLSAALAVTDRKKKVDGVVLNITLLVCFGLVVNITVYILMLITPNMALAVFQIILFVLSSIAHFAYGAAINHFNPPR